MSDYMKEMERLLDAFGQYKWSAGVNAAGFSHRQSRNDREAADEARAALLAHAAQRDHIEDVLGMVQSVELPEPDTHCYDTDEERDVWSHSPDQMRTYGDAREAAGYARGVAEERERCAAICDRMGNPLNVKYEGGGCRKAAAAIRAAQKGIE